jgi:hydrogenase nickel incorporation protein HypA/HybF
VHELAICQGLIEQVQTLARVHGAKAVRRIHLQLGPLCGVEAALLEPAFTFARLGTLASDAILEITRLPVRVRCQTCDAETEALPNRLTCCQCGDWHTELLQGDEIILTSLELELEENHV